MSTKDDVVRLPDHTKSSFLFCKSGMPKLTVALPRLIDSNDIRLTVIIIVSKQLRSAVKH